ncbi:DUF2846 domain-containing protein [Rodentibacter caecimuris]|uniref:DUF2846 domain-containing protein n=1 Tax=Rodentibacter caecimuris TaxID=1796644 RepID=UPI00258C7932|nr:DUF2846 domain-containing protein [Rodentibacter heylii]
MKKFFNFLGLSVVLFLTACAKEPIASQEEMVNAKQFKAPPKNKSALYVYRENHFGGYALRKAISIDGKEIGSLVRGTFLYTLLPPGQHRISTYSEFGRNHLDLSMKEGKNYFVKQELKMGVFFAGAKLTEVSENQGKQDISQLKMTTIRQFKKRDF